MRNGVIAERSGAASGGALPALDALDKPTIVTA